MQIGGAKEPLLRPPEVCTLAARPAESASKDYGSMARRRYQTGRVFIRGKKNPVYIGRYRDDVIGPDGKTRRIERSVILGSVSELKTEKNARRAFEPFLAGVNSVDYRPRRFANIGEFSEGWEREVLQHHKPSSIKAAQSHLRTYIRPWLRDIRLDEFSPQAQQSFVTRLSKNVSRKTVLNVLTTLGSIMRTAKAWGYCCHTINLGDLTLPADKASSPAIAWCQRTAAPYNTSALAYRDRLYVLYDKGLLACLDARSGEIIYSKQRINGRAFTASPWAYRGKVFCLSEYGETFVIEAGDDFKLLRTNPLAEDEMCMATPAVVGDRLLVRGAERMYSIRRHRAAP